MLSPEWMSAAPAWSCQWRWSGEVNSGNIRTRFTTSIERDDDDDEIAYFTVRWKTRASFVYRTKNIR